MKRIVRISLRVNSSSLLASTFGQAIAQHPTRGNVQQNGMVFSSFAKAFMRFVVVGMVLLGGWVNRVEAQVANYTFAASSGTYTPIAGGTILASGSWDDSGAGIAIPIGFTFIYNGASFTTCNINLNGYISFGSTTTTSNYTPISTLVAGETGTIGGFGRDLQGTAVTGEIRYLSTGGVFTVQWTAAKRYNAGTATTETFDFQIQLVQTTNVIKIVYGTYANASATGTPDATLPQVGLRGTTTADFKNESVLSAGNWATPAAGGANTATCFYNESNTATKPASGQTYTFSPPATLCCPD